MPKHKWKFKSYFRREAYGWNGTAKASKRMKEALSEIKKVAKQDSALAGQGVIELYTRLYPSMMHIDSSSGTLGTALHNTVEQLIPLLISADWDMNTRGKWLEKLFEAIQEDGWGTFDDLRDQWGEICVYPGLAHLWADRLLPTVKEVWTSPSYSYFVGTDMCLSCLLYTERYDELYSLLQLREKKLWFDHKFWAMALVKQGKFQEALDYAQMIQSGEVNKSYSIDIFCEDTLIEMGRIEDAYQQYGLKLPDYGTYLNKYRAICKKYPLIDKKKILIDCIVKTHEKGKWFASAKSSGYLDIALECAEHSSSDPNTLMRAVKEYREKDSQFAVQVGIWAIIRLMTGSFYEEVTATEIARAYRDVEKVAQKSGQAEEFKTQLSRQVLKCNGQRYAHLRETVVNRLKG